MFRNSELEMINMFLSDFVYSLREQNKMRKFKRLIRQGVEKCEPRFRCITSLSEPSVPGSVEFAHISRYHFAKERISGRVLNAACGSGYGNAILAEKGAIPTGVDLFEAPLKIARDCFPVGEYHQCDAQELALFDDESFDSVVSFETIEHVFDAVRASVSFKRVLKEGGVFVGSIPIMVFHNPGRNFTWSLANDFVDENFPGAEKFIQTNSEIRPHSVINWRELRDNGDKYLIWVWRK